MIDAEATPLPDTGKVAGAVRTRTLSMKEQVSKLVNTTLDEILRDAKKRAPISEDGSFPTWVRGALRRSGRKEKERGATEGSVLFGDEDAPYAIYVHEDLTKAHVTGEAKFLENALIDALPEFFHRLRLIGKGVGSGQMILTPKDDDGDSG